MEMTKPEGRNPKVADAPALPCGGRRLKPMGKWARWGVGPVWEESLTGARVHAFGLLRLPDGSRVTPSWGEERFFRAHQPRQKRWLMVWAEWKIKQLMEGRAA